MASFDDIYGHENEKRELMMMCDMVRHSAKNRQAGIAITKALLLHGAPGVGKALMAKAFVKQSGSCCFTLRRDAGDANTFVEHVNRVYLQTKIRS